MNKNNTYTPKAKEIKREWHFFDATDKVLGELAVEVSQILQGKNKPTFATHINVGDKVVVTNASKVKTTGNKLAKKIYYRYTGFPKGLRSENLGDLLRRKPTEVIFKAVKRMLPQNKLLSERLRNLYIYESAEHPHQAQESK